MNSIKNKLRSRAGASLVLAIMFMLFCSFVGGSVLASATANAQRVAQIAEQQDFLLERSVALLASDTLQLEDGEYLRLSVSDSIRTIEKVTISEEGGLVVPIDETEQRVITFQVSTTAPLTQMHQLLLEATVHRYLRENAPDYTVGHPYYVINLVHFPEEPVTVEDFLFKYSQPGAESHDHTIEGTLKISANVQGSSGVTIPEYTANFTSGWGDNLFDFFVYFGEESQVKMTVNAYYGTSNPFSVPSTPEIGLFPGETTPTTIRITDETTQHTISWEDPLIEKGGAE